VARGLGDRAQRRARPRLGVALAGAGVGLLLVGVLLWSGTYLVDGIAQSFEPGGGSDSRKLLGGFLCLAAVLLGYLTLGRWRRGPLSAAGVAASALGVPLMMAFFTFDVSSDPVSPDAIAIVSLIVWLVSYLAVPGARGHVFYLGLSGMVLWSYVLGKIGGDGGAGGTLARHIDSPLGSAFGSASDADPATIAAISLIFGLGYYASAFHLDRTGRPGVGAGLLYGAFPATVTGISALAYDIKQVGTGLVLVALGTILAGFAARSERRFTTWAWSGAAVLGVALVIAKAVGSGNTALLGVLFVVFGLVVIFAASVLARRLGESDELTPSPAGAVH
jgi:hypothetical protein